MSPTDVLVLDPKARDRVAEDRELRARGPVARVDLLGLEAWAVSHPDYLKRLLTDNRVSKDSRRHYPDFEQTVQRWPLWLWIAVENMFTAYGTDHRALRRLVGPAFNHRRTQAMRPVIQDITDRLLTRMLAKQEAGDLVDLRADFAHQLPMDVIHHLMGMPREWQEAMADPVAKVFDTSLDIAAALQNGEGLKALLARFIERKRAHPADDLTTDLIHARDGERRLSEEQLVDTLLLVFTAGYETTVGLIVNTHRNLLTHPRQLDIVRRNPKEATVAAVQETLRRDASIAFLPLRYATEPIDLPEAGVRIGQGEPILAAYSAAGRHPDIFEQPDVFDVLRPNASGHLAFGHGAHLCLGAPLAIAEAEIATRSVLNAFPDAVLAVEEHQLTPVESVISNSLRELPITRRGEKKTGEAA
ncbi:Cytochrome P450 [Streptomyces sp. MnatMP-M77]|uniref:cytochrome P450 family protein n=1 Tax=unclassified Streptomyces TaxID=2593676 RepID=UPI00080498C4|nr:cytochrome P450 [Streptomyces sp. MnatMP-M77]MYT82382.1 cytochrome P450 [Streptomyces sp. SID8364]SBU96400.1 Cytochrome P450 [Streptomyces sp. MnatMP-M77]